MKLALISTCFRKVADSFAKWQRFCSALCQLVSLLLLYSLRGSHLFCGHSINCSAPWTRFPWRRNWFFLKWVFQLYCHLRERSSFWTVWSNENGLSQRHYSRWLIDHSPWVYWCSLFDSLCQFFNCRNFVTCILLRCMHIPKMAFCYSSLNTNTVYTIWYGEQTYKVVQIWPGLSVCKQVTVYPGHIWTTLYV
jgi:hypothetical protein